MKKKLLALTVFSVSSFFLPSVSAETYDYLWTGEAYADIHWSNPANWTQVLNPLSPENSFHYIDVDNATVLIDTTDETDIDPAATNVSGSRIGYYASNVTLNITGGSLTSGQLRLSYKPGGSCTVNISGDGALVSNTYIRMSYCDKWEEGEEGSACTINLSDNATLDLSTYLRTGYADSGPGEAVINITDNATMSMNGYLRSAYDSNNTTTVTVSGNGRLNIGNYYRVANSGYGYLNVMDNGVVDIANQFFVPYSPGGDAFVSLQNGTIYTGQLVMDKGNGLVDIWNGSLVIDGDAVSTVNNYVSAGKIAAFGIRQGDPGFGTTAGVLVKYDLSKTTVTAFSLLASNPSPGKGEEVIAEKITLSWAAGRGSASHDVYFGTSFEDVNNGTADTFKGSQSLAETSYGPIDCEIGQTYYWRIDEVNAVTHKGVVWDFKRVIDPEPMWDDGEPGSSLWSDPSNWNNDLLPGFGSTAYLDLAGSTCLITAGTDALCTYLYGPAYNNSDITLNVTGGSLTTIDAIRMAYTGGVSGTINVSGDGTVNVGSHMRMAYDTNTYGELNISGNGTVNVNEYVRMAYEPNANATIDISDNGSLNINSYLRAAYYRDTYSTVNISGSGQLNVGDYYRIGGGGDGTLNINGGQVNVAGVMYIPTISSGSGNVNIVDGTVAVGGLEMLAGSGLIDITTGNGKLVVDGDATSLIKTYVDKEMITGDGTPWLVSVDYDGSDTTVKADAGADLTLAYNPTPARDQENVAANVTLTWYQGLGAASHDVFLGTNFDNVNEGAGGTFKGNLSPAEANSYGPLDLKLGTTYYWRISEVDVDGVTLSKGEVWKFTVINYDVLEGFDRYSGTGNNVSSGTLRYVWKDGYSWTPEKTGSNIALVVEENPVDQFVGPVRTGGKSMLYSYNNNAGSRSSEYPLAFTPFYTPLSTYSEIEADVDNLGFGSNWTEDDVKVLGIYFYGDPDNDVNEQMYAAVKDRSAHLSDMVIYGEPNNLKKAEWQRWDIDLQDFATNGVNLSSIDKIYIGFGNRDSAQAGGKGVVYFDELRLYTRR